MHPSYSAAFGVLATTLEPEQLEELPDDVRRLVDQARRAKMPPMDDGPFRDFQATWSALCREAGLSVLTSLEALSVDTEGESARVGVHWKDEEEALRILRRMNEAFSALGYPGALSGTSSLGYALRSLYRRYPGRFIRRVKGRKPAAWGVQKPPAEQSDAAASASPHGPTHPPPTLVRVEGWRWWLACGGCKRVRMATSVANGVGLVVRDHYQRGRSVECPGSGARYEPPLAGAGRP